MHYLIYHLPGLKAPLLPPEALDATERTAYARRGEPYLLMRSLLKHELARHSGEAPESIHFSYGAHGKPLYPPQPFNMSHSGELLCIALHHSEIGVDIERMRPRKHMPAMAERIMCPGQLAAWQERGCGVEEFFDCWCAAEALAKQCGGSLWHAQQRPFMWHPGGSICPLYDDAPRVELFEPAPGYRGAVAYMDAPFALQD